MGKKENDQLRKKKNEHFIKAFEYVAECKKMNQTQLAAAIGSKAAYISVYRNGTRPVPEETIDALIRISSTIRSGNGQIYKPYLLGLSDYMLLHNVPDDEIVNVELRKTNPDYDIIQTRRESKWKEIENRIRQSGQPIPTESMEASRNGIADLLDAKDQMIQELRDKYNKMEEEKNARIAILEKLAEERFHQIVRLQRIIDANKLNDGLLPVGVATYK